MAASPDLRERQPVAQPLGDAEDDPSAITDPGFVPPWLPAEPLAPFAPDEDSPAGGRPSLARWLGRLRTSPRPRRFGIAALVLLLLPLAASALLRLPPIARALSDRARRALLDRLPGAELMGEVRVGLTGVEIHGLRWAGPAPAAPPTLSAELAVVRPDLAALASGRIQPRSIELRWVRIHPGPRGEALRALLSRAGGHPRSSSPRPGAASRPPELRIRDLYVDMPTLDAEGSTTLGPLELRLDWRRTSRGTVELRLHGGLLDGRGGRFSVTGSLSRETGAGTLGFELRGLRAADLPPGWFGDRGVELPAGTIDGAFEGRRSEKGEMEGHGSLAAEGLAIVWPRLDPKPVGPIAGSIEGDVAWDPDSRRLSLRAGRAHFAAAVLDADGALTLSGARPVELRIDAPAVDLQKVVDALPAPLRPPPEAPRLEGTFSARFALRGPLRKPDEIEFERAELDLGGLREAARRDGEEGFLRRPFEYRPKAPDGPQRIIEVGPRNPRFVPYASLPQWVARAVVVSEDGGFFGHHGFDFDEIKESILRDVETGEAVRGGSTITQQLVKNLFLSREKTLSRKIREALVTLEVEATVPKWRILEVYLNTIEWGPDVYGIGEAALRYFAVPATQLTPREAAFLATIIPAPRRFYQIYYEARSVTPHLNERIDRLLGRMHEYGILDDAAFAEATAAPIEFRRGPRARATQPTAAAVRPAPERSLWERLFGR